MPEATLSEATKATLEALAAGGQMALPLRAKLNVRAMGAATALTLQADEDSMVAVLALTDNSVITLPLASTCKGMLVKVVAVCADAASKISISPNAADAIDGSVVGITGAGNATVVASGGVTNKDWIMTKATINKGDYVDLLSDGVDTWLIVGGIGEQASEG